MTCAPELRLDSPLVVHGSTPAMSSAVHEVRAPPSLLATQPADGTQGWRSACSWGVSVGEGSSPYLRVSLTYLLGAS